MGQDVNSASIAATSTSASAASVTATASAVAGRAIQVVGFDGSSNDQAIKVELKFGSTVKATMHGASNLPVGRYFDIQNGPVADFNTAVTCVVTPAATGQCDANLYYRFIV